MLLHIKGRTHIQTRLVEPIYTSINKGDCFILVAGNKLFSFVGSLANVIEKSRCKNICASILENKDLGCRAKQEFVINDGKINNEKHVSDFWKILGRNEDFEEIEAGHADEDDLFEQLLFQTNMIYVYEDETLVPMENYWGGLPKIEMLDAKKVIVFDFGSEVYVWNGKNATSDCKRAAMKLAQEMFTNRYDYEICELNPLNFSQITGDRSSYKFKKSDNRPEWCILAKVTQHMETILFREKFIDWPEVAREDLDKDYLSGLGTDVRKLDGAAMFKGEPYEEPNLILENSNLGRGNFFYDTDTMRHFDILTDSVSKWQIHEFTFDDAGDSSSYCHFYSSESYIIRWIYQISVTVRELSGKISKRNTVGRDRCVYFCWQGLDSSANEKGAAALLTVELDKEKGAQLRLSQGDEPTAFIRLFKTLFIHKGKPDEDEGKKNSWRMYLIRGNDVCESILTEVDCSIKQLRSRGSILMVHGESGKIIVWHGSKSLKHTRNVAINASEELEKSNYSGFFSNGFIEIEEIFEGKETDEFFKAIGGENREDYLSLLNSEKTFNFTPRLFYFTSNNGEFEANEILSNLRVKDEFTPFPFTQRDLYKVRQPAIFLIDNGDKLWLWQGWWPQEEPTSDADSPTIENRANEVRWQLERRTAMETAVDYWKAKIKKLNLDDEIGHDEVDETENAMGYAVWAGLETLEFTSIFPEWVNKDEIAEMNIQDGRTTTPIPITECLSLLSRSEYPLTTLLERPLPEGVNPTKLELYLAETEFEKALGMTKPDFDELPLWKQTKLKKERGLF